jgi:predicted transcriptional regulator
MTEKTIRVGGSLQQAAAEVADAWTKAERGEAVAPSDQTTFLTWSALASVMTDKRHELIIHLHDHPATSIRGLARELGRDYKRVHEDLRALLSVGLVEHDGTAWHADYDEITTAIRVKSAA